MDAASASAVPLIDASTLQIDVNPFNNAGIAFTTVWPAFSVPDINVTPTSLDFGTVIIGGASELKTVTISNTGAANLTIHNITISNSRFTISGSDPSGTTLAPGASVNVTLVFEPSAEGPQSGTMNISLQRPG